MKNKYLPIILVITFAVAGCETTGEQTKKGAVVGGVVGAAAGGIIGHQDGHGWEGALIGTAAGATIGGLLGHHKDKKAAVNPNHVSIVKIVEMAKNNVPDEIIIDEINRTKSKYQLNAEIMDYLRNNGVSNKVINHMLRTS